jgi:hypothetical protein
VQRRVECCEQTRHLVAAEHHRQGLAMASLGDRAGHLRAPKHRRVQETKRTRVLIPRIRRKTPLTGQMQQEGLNLIAAELARASSSVILGKLAHAPRVRLDRRRPLASNLHCGHHLR